MLDFNIYNMLYEFKTILVRKEFLAFQNKKNQGVFLPGDFVFFFELKFFNIGIFMIDLLTACKSLVHGNFVCFLVKFGIHFLDMVLV